MKTRLLFLFIIFTLGFGVKKAGAATFDWVGNAGVGSKTSWTNGLNWNYNGGANGNALLFPGSAGNTDVVNIGNGTSYSTNQPTLNYVLSGLGVNITIAQLNVGSSNSGTLTLTTQLISTGAITVNNNGFTFTGGALLTGYNFVGSGNTTMNTPMTITNGDIYLNNPYSFTSNSAGVINGITFTGNYNNAVSFGANVTLTGGTVSGSTYSMTIPQSGSLTNATTATIKCPSLYLGYGVTATLNGPVNLTGLLNLVQNAQITAGTSATISAGNMTLNYTNTINTSASITVTSGGTLNINTGNITTNNTSSTINVPNIIARSDGTNTFSCLGVVTVSTLLTITAGTINFTTTNSSLLSPAAVTLSTVSASTIGVDMPMTVSGAITANSGSTINSNATGVISAGSMAITGSGLNLSATCTTSGNVNFVIGTTIVTGTPLFKGGTVTLTSGTLGLDEPLTSTGLFTIGNGSTLTGNNIAIINAGSMSITGATISLQAAASTTTADITFVSGTTSFINTALTSSAGNVTVSAGTLTLQSAVTATGNFNTASGTTFNANSGTSAITCNTYQIGGTYNVNVNCTVTSTSALGYINNGMAFNTGGVTLTFLGAGSIAVSGTTALPSAAYIVIGSSSSSTPGLSFAAGSTLQTSSSPAAVTNYGKLNFTGTGSGSGAVVTVSFGSSNNVITNQSTGVVTATYTNMTFSGTSSGITNNGKFTSSSLYVNIDASSNFLTNTGTFTASAFTCSNTANNNPVTISNSGTFTANGGSTFNLTAYQMTITNTGVFNAGTSGSACTINLSAQSANITNTGSSSQTAYFNLGSTSVINLTSGYQANVTNTSNAYSIFTFMSDAKGSATAAQIQLTSYSNGGTGFLGTYNVQRYISTGTPATSYKGYRLLTSATNLNSNGNPVTPSATNYIDFSNFSSTATKNTYKVFDHLTSSNTYYGVYTGGTTGFTISNANPTMYLWDEKLQPTAATKNTTFTSGKNMGLTSISGSVVSGGGKTNGLAYTNNNISIPVGNGYLVYYIGSINGRSLTNPELTAPDTAVITNVGYFNQQSIPVYLWYTPAGGSAGQLSYSNALSTVDPYTNFNMVGNPYASTIDLDSLYHDNNSSITGPIYELNDPGQTYVSFNPKFHTTSGTNPSAYIVSGQGFFVVAAAAAKTLTFNEQDKVNTQLTASSTPSIMLSVKTPADQIMGLHLKLMQDSITNTQTGIYFSPAWSDAYSVQEDAIDLDGLAPKVFLSSFSTDGMRLCINQLGDYTKGKRVKLFVKATSDGVYNLKLADILSIDTTDYNVYLIDTKQNDSLDMVRYKSYAFNFSVADTASYDKRFVLAIEQKPMPPYKLITFTGQKVATGVLLDWETENAGDYTGFVLQKQGANNQFNPIYTKQSDGTSAYNYIDTNPVTGANIYRLQQNDINGLLSYSGLVTVLYSASTANNSAFTIYPNPSKSIINVSLNSTSTSTLNLQSKIYNTVGQVMAQRTVNTNTWTEDVTSYKEGVYIIELKDNAGNLVGKSKFVKTN